MAPRQSSAAVRSAVPCRPSVAHEFGRQVHEADEVGLFQRARGAERMIKQRVAEKAAGVGGGADGHAELGEALKDAFDRQRALKVQAGPSSSRQSPAGKWPAASATALHALRPTSSIWNPSAWCDTPK